jgi:hypothetical protein
LESTFEAPFPEEDDGESPQPQTNSAANALTQTVVNRARRVAANRERSE